jgi:fumarylacetoacetate (FAA) hydrolase family protein
MENTMHDEMAAYLPQDLDQAVLVGRAWRTGAIDGPAVVVVRQGEVFDVTALCGTTADLFERADLLDVVRHGAGEALGRVEALLADTLGGTGAVRLLAPCDLQPIKVGARDRRAGRRRRGARDRIARGNAADHRRRPVGDPSRFARSGAPEG